MTKRIEQSAVLPYTPAQMYALVNDVESYPQFLPWCQSAQLLSKSEHELRASLALSKAGVQQKLTTRNVMHPDERIEMQLVEGPFKKLSGIWTFQSQGAEQTLVRLVMEFEFKNRLIAIALGKLFDEITGTMVKAFCDRAHAIYGGGMST